MWEMWRSRAISGGFGVSAHRASLSSPGQMVKCSSYPHRRTLRAIAIRGHKDDAELEEIYKSRPLLTGFELPVSHSLRTSRHSTSLLYTTYRLTRPGAITPRTYTYTHIRHHAVHHAPSPSLHHRSLGPDRPDRAYRPERQRYAYSAACLMLQR